MEQKPIKEFQGENRWLSNFWPCVIVLDGIKYPSVEAAYMSAKSEDLEWKKVCSNLTNSPGTIKRMSKKLKVRKDWDNLKLKYMEYCLRVKFSHTDLRRKLLSTGWVNIQEGNRWGDTFWGIDLITGKGQNHLGELIMKIRLEIIEKAN